jgi:hypothetical protein
MTPGPVEEGAKVATGVVDALRGEPISLALIVMNVIFIGAVGWWAREINIRTTHQYEVKDALIEKLIDQCRQNKSTSFKAPTLTEPSMSEQP